MLTILGPTASGKTTLAVALADRLHTEIISGDSRQVYRGMDLGTGKDIDDYTIRRKSTVNGQWSTVNVTVPYHLIDIVDAGTKYTVYDFQRDFRKAYDDITARGMEPIFCGGSGLYLESVLRGYRLPDVPANKQLRDSLEGKSLAELTDILASYKSLHNTTDIDSPQRAIRAIEIETYCADHAATLRPFPDIPNITFGISIPRELRRQRITERLHARLDAGMLDEVRGLLNSGIKPEDLIYYGLEYKFLTRHLIDEISYEQMVSGLEIAIHQFAKRQMTWFRGMERRGITIHWIDGTLPMEDKVRQILDIVAKK